MYRLYFLQYIMHMTSFIVYVQVTVSFVVMYVTVSSSKLTPTFHKIDQKTFYKALYQVCISPPFVNILPKLRYFLGRNYMQIS